MVKNASCVHWSISYNLALLLLSLFFLPVAIYKMVRWNKYWAEWRERFGKYEQEPIPSEIFVIWVHAVSVGEVQAVKPLLEEIAKANRPFHLLLSTTTATGQSVAKKIAKALSKCTTIFSPLDFPWVVEKTFAHFHPNALILVETELWPNLLTAAHKRDIPVFIVNGRLSEHSAKRYRMIRPWFKRFLSAVTLCGAQSEANAKRFVEIGIAPERVFVGGNLKYDGLDRLAQSALFKSQELRELFDLRENEFVLVGGSTHAGEEEVLLSLYEKFSKRFPRSTLILAPRHPERLGDVANLIIKFGFCAKTRSAFGKRSEDHQVILLDTMGELPTIYALSSLVFIGKSLFPPGGGHNPLEAVALGKVTFFGPQMSNFKEIAEDLLSNDAAITVLDATDLENRLEFLLHDKKRKREIEQNAQQLFASKGNVAGQYWKAISATLHI